jgi:uncharacterized protein YggE
MSIRMTSPNSETGPTGPQSRLGNPSPHPTRHTRMSSQLISRGASTAVAALLLGGAFVIGTTYSGRQAPAANAATPSLPVAAVSGQTGAVQGITVSGTSEVAGTPDTLRLDLAVTTQANTVGKALGQANGLTAAVQSALRRHCVAAKDVQTSDLQIQPDYSYPSSGTPVLRGYTVTEGITARLRNIGKAGDVIAAATAAGGNATRINGVSLDLEETGRLVRAARDKAVADARAKAEQYAKAVGRALGQVTNITEAVSAPPAVDYSMRTAAAPAPMKDVPIAPGSESVGVTVTITYAFGQ